MQLSYETYLNILIAVGIAVITVVIGYVVGRVSRRVVVYILSRIGFDGWFRKFAIGRAIIRGGYSSSEFFGLIVSWIIYLVFIFLGIALAALYMDLAWLAEASYSIIYVYVWGFVKAFLIMITGFILTDAFVGYIYKSSEFREEARLITPLAEYLRIIIYLAIVLFALEQGGLNVHTLNILITPVIWGLTIAMIIMMIAQILQQVVRR
ncbi:MAG: hypothetical protein ABWJ42_00740 [Sulfolobales archaeon]